MIIRIKNIYLNRSVDTYVFHTITDGNIGKKLITSCSTAPANIITFHGIGCERTYLFISPKPGFFFVHPGMYVYWDIHIEGRILGQSM